MALDSSLVRVAVTGGIYANLDGGASAPTSATSDLGPDLDEMGYLTDAGVVMAIDSTTENITAWQNADNVRTIQTAHDVTFDLTLLETNEHTMRAFFGNYDDGHVQVTGDVMPRMLWVLDVLDGDQKIRVVIPEGQITERGDVSMVNGQAMSYPITLTAYPVDGVKAHIYLASAVSS
jgi:hypothetical protein